MTIVDDATSRPTAGSARDDAALAGVLPALLRRRRRARARGRGSSTSTAAASSTSARASPSPTSATATRRWSRPSSAQARDADAHVGRRPPPPATSSWPSGSAACARSSTSRRCSSATRAPRRSTARIKLARQVTGRPGVIAFRRGVPRPHAGGHVAHHRQGQVPRGLRAAAAAASPSRPTASRTSTPATPRPRRGRAGRARRAARRCRRRAGNVGAMIVEPVLGEGGYVVPPVAWLAGPARALRRARHPARVRRGAVRHRPHRPAVRGRDLRRRARRAPVRQGHRLGPAARRDHRRRARSWSAGRPAPTARPSAATRWRARPPWPPSTCSTTTACYDARPSCSATRAVARLRRDGRGHDAVVDVRGIGLMIGVELRDKAAADRGAAALPRRRADRAHLRARRERAAAHPAAHDHRRRARPRPRHPLRRHPGGLSTLRTRFPRESGR